MSDTRKPVTITREDLYAQVWASPMSTLAESLGISGNGLAKICRRLSIPYPGRGYWARKAAGQKVKQIPLPALRQGEPTQATITPTEPAPTLSHELASALAAARILAASLTVPEKLARAHPIIAGWIAERKERREHARRWYSSGPLPADFSPIERRRNRILNALFLALDKHGYVAKTDDRGHIFVEAGGEAAYVTLKEKYRQARRPLTDDEKRQGFNPKRPWKQETQPTGLLQFVIETQLDPALTHSWIDAPEQPLESRVPEIAAALLAAAPILQERRRRYEEAEKRRAEEERRRYEERQQKLKERNRLRAFLELAARWKEAQVAREFLNALAAHGDDLKQTIGDRPGEEWIAWARDRLSAHDPLEAGAPGVFEAIAAVDQWTYRESWGAE